MTRAGALALVTVLAVGCTGDDGTEPSDPPPAAELGSVEQIPDPAPATAEPVDAGLEAPHSGDMRATSNCPDGSEMLDWDNDGWGDCVAAAGPPTAPTAP